MAGGKFVLRSENDTENPILPRLYHVGITQGLLVFYLPNAVGNRTGLITLLSEGARYTGDTGCAGIDIVLYAGFEIPELDESGGRNWKFHAGTIPTAPTYKACTMAASGSVVTSAAHGYSNGTKVALRTRGASGTMPVEPYTEYTVANVTTNTFTLKDAAGVASITFAADSVGECFVYASTGIGLFDTEQGKPTLFPWLPQNFAGISYLELLVPADLSNGEDEPTKLKIRMRGKKVFDFADGGGSGLVPTGSAIESVNPAQIAYDVLKGDGNFLGTRFGATSWLAWRDRCSETVTWVGGAAAAAIPTAFAYLATGIVYNAATATLSRTASTGWVNAVTNLLPLGDASIEMSLVFGNAQLFFTSSSIGATKRHGLIAENAVLYYTDGTTQTTLDSCGAGTRLKIEYVGGVFNAYKNGVLLTLPASVDQPAGSFYSAIGLYTASASVNAVVLSPAGTVSAPRAIPRFTGGVVIAGKASVGEIFENEVALCGGVSWQDVDGKIEILTRPDRAAAVTFNADPNSAYKTNCRKITVNRRDPRLAPNYYPFSFRDADDAQLTKKYDFIDRPERRTVVGHIAAPVHENGVMSQSQAQRNEEARARVQTDMDMFWTVEAFLDTLPAAKGDFCWIIDPVSGYDDSNPALGTIIKERLSFNGGVEMKFYDVAQITSDFYSDTAHGAVIPIQHNHIATRYLPPPVLSALTLAESFRNLANASASIIDGTATFGNYPEQRGRVYYRSFGISLASVTLANATNYATGTDAIANTALAALSGASVYIVPIGSAVLPTELNSKTVYELHLVSGSNYTLRVGGVATDFSTNGTGDFRIVPIAPTWITTDKLLVPDSTTLQATFALDALGSGVHEVCVVSESLGGVSLPFATHLTRFIDVVGDLVAPSPPTDLRCFYDGLNLNWSWQPSPTLSVSGYQITDENGTIIAQYVAELAFSESARTLTTARRVYAVSRFGVRSTTYALLEFIIPPTLEWVDIQGGAIGSNGTFVKTAVDGWNAGASFSQAILTELIDSSLRIPPVTATNKTRIFGLTRDGAAGSPYVTTYTQFYFGVRLNNDGTVDAIYQSGGTQTVACGSYIVGDEFEIIRYGPTGLSGGTTYMLNRITTGRTGRKTQLLYTFATSGDPYPLYASVAVYSSGATIAPYITLTGALVPTTPITPVWQNNLSLDVAGNRLTSNNALNIGSTWSVDAIPANTDGVVGFTFQSGVAASVGFCLADPAQVENNLNISVRHSASDTTNIFIQNTKVYTGGSIGNVFSLSREDGYIVVRAAGVTIYQVLISGEVTSMALPVTAALHIGVVFSSTGQLAKYVDLIELRPVRAAGQTGTSGKTLPVTALVSAARVGTQSAYAIPTFNITSPTVAGQVLIFNAAGEVVNGTATSGVADGTYTDIVVSGSGTIFTIATNAVTLAKMAQMATASFLGRNTASTGNVEVLSIATVKTMLGLTGTNSGDQTITLTGDVTGSGTGSFAATIASGAVSLAKMANLAANSIIGNNTGSAATPIALTVSQTRTLLGLGSGDSPTFADLTVSNLIVNGTTTTVHSTTLTVDDPLIKLATNNTSTDAVDTGFYAAYGSSGTKYAGLFRDATDNTFRFFYGLTVEPTTTVNTAHASYITATIQANVTLGDITSCTFKSSSANQFEDGGLRLLDNSNSQALTIRAYEDLSTNRELLIITNDATRFLTISGDATISGTNTGNQTITLTGDVTGSGTGSFAATIANNAVTLAKMAQMATASFLGRNTAATGNVEVLSIATVKTMLGLTGTNSGDQTITLTGDVTGTGTGSFAATIAAAAVSLSKMANLAANSIIGNNTGSSATPLALSVSQTRTLLGLGTADSPTFTAITAPIVTAITRVITTTLRLNDNTASFYMNVISGETLTAARTLSIAINDADRTLNITGHVTALSGAHTGSSSGTNTGDQTITLTGDVTGTGQGSFAATIANNAVTLAKMAQMATASFLGRNTASTGNVEVLSVATVKTMLGLTGTNSGDQTITLTSDVTGSGTSSFVTTIAGGAVTLAKMALLAANSIIGNNTGSSATPLALTASQVRTLLGLGTADSPTFTALTSPIVTAITRIHTTTLRLNDNMATSYMQIISGEELTAPRTLSIAINDADRTLNITGHVTALSGAHTGSSSGTNTGDQIMASGTVSYRKTSGSGAPEAQTIATLKTDLGLTGTNSGDQTITLTGDVTGTGTGSFAATIANNAVTLAKMAQMATASFLGRNTASTGNVEVLSISTVKTMLGLTGTNSGDQTITLTGDVTGSGTGSFAATIASGAVTLGKMAALAANSIIGNNTGSSATPVALSVSQTRTLLGLGTADSPTFADLTVSNLIVNGTTTTVHSTTLTIDDPLIKLATNNTSTDAVDTGFYAAYGASGTKYAGLFRDATDGVFRLFFGTATEPTATVNTAALGYTQATLEANIVSGDLNSCTFKSSSPNSFEDGGLRLLDDSNSQALVIRCYETLGTTRELLIITNDATRFLTISGDATISGVNTGNQTITLTGDVTGSGTGSFAATIANNAVSLAKMAQMATASFLGRNTPSTGNVEVLSVATVKTMLGLTGTNSGDQTSIVGITGTKAQFNTAATDGDFAFIGDAMGTIADFFSDRTTHGTTEEYLYAATIAAATLTVNGDKLIGRFTGTTASNSNSKEWRLKFAGTSIANPTESANVGDWVIDYEIIRINNTTVKCSSSFICNGSQYAVSKYVNISSLNLTTTDYDLILYGVTATAAGDITARTGRVDQERAAPVVSPANWAGIWGVWEASTFGQTDGSNITAANWTDTVGIAGNAARTGTPTYELDAGYAALRFGGSAYYTLPSMSGFTSAAIFQVKIINDISPDAGDNFSGVGTDTAPFHTDGQIYSTFCTTVRKDNIVPKATLTNWHIEYIHSAASNWRMDHNGVVAYSTASNATHFRSDPMLCRNAGSVNKKADVAGVYIFKDTIPTDATYRKVMAYLQQTYGLG